MDLNQARTFVAQLKPDATFYLGGEPFVVTSKDCSVVEFCRPAHKEITGAYHRASVENLVIALTGDLAEVAKVAP